MRKLVACLVALLATTAANASVIFVGSPAGLAPDGNINWGSLGPPFTNLTNPFNVGVSGIPGLNATVSQTVNTNAQRRDQGNGWNGNFAPGATLLWTQGNNGPVDILFSAPVAGAGAQFQADFFGAFVGNISAFDSANNLLGSFNFNGNSTSAGDNSAVFAGILSTDGDIRRIRFSGVSATSQPQDFAIGNVRVQAAPTPEPISLVVFGGLLVGGAGVALRRRMTAKATA